MLPVAVSVAAPVMILSAGAVLTVVAVEATSAGTVWVLERASDGARASVRLGARAADGPLVGSRHRGRRSPRSAPAGCCRRPARRSRSCRTRSAPRCSTTSASRDEAVPAPALAIALLAARPGPRRPGAAAKRARRARTRSTLAGARPAHRRAPRRHRRPGRRAGAGRAGPVRVRAALLAPRPRLPRRRGPTAVWRVVHKLNACGSAQASVYRQGLGEFFLDDLYRYEAAIVVLQPDVQARLLPALRDNERLARLHTPAYNMVAYPWSIRYQQSNQWAIETLACAQDAGGRDARPRAGLAAAAGLRADDPAPVGAEAPRRAGRGGQRRIRRPSERQALRRPHRDRHGRFGLRLAEPQRPRRTGRRSSGRFAGGFSHRREQLWNLTTRRPSEPVRAAGAAPLRPVLLDPVPRRRQRQPVQVRVHRDGDLPAAGRVAADRSSPAS